MSAGSEALRADTAALAHCTADEPWPCPPELEELHGILRASLPPRHVSALLGAIRTGTGGAAQLALELCMLLVKQSPVQARQLIDAGLVEALVDCVCCSSPADAPHKTPTSASSAPCAVNGAWCALGWLAWQQPSATLAALGGAQGAALSRLLAEVGEGSRARDATTVNSFTALANIASAGEPVVAVCIASNAAVMQAAVQQTDALLQAPGKHRLTGMALISRLLDPKNPEARAAAASTPGLAAAAVRVLTAAVDQAVVCTHPEDEKNALGVLERLTEGWVTREATAPVIVAAGDATIQHILRLASHADGATAYAAASICYRLVRTQVGWAMERQKSFASEMLSAMCHPTGGKADAAYRDDAARLALRALGGSKAESVARGLEAIAPKVASSALPRMAEMFEDLIDARCFDKFSPYIASKSMAAVVGPLVKGCEAAGQMAEASAAPRALEAAVRWALLAMTTNPRSSAAEMKSSGIQQAGMDLLGTVGCWAAAARCAARASALPCWDPEDVEALLAVVQQIAAWLQCRPSPDHLKCRTVAADLAALLQVMPAKDVDGQRRQQLRLRRGQQQRKQEDAGKQRPKRQPPQKQRHWRRQQKGQQKQKWRKQQQWLEQQDTIDRQQQEEKVQEERRQQERDQLQKDVQQQAGQSQLSAATTAAVSGADGAWPPTCTTCGAASARDGGLLKRCKGCHSDFPKYCSVACYEAGWPAHKVACKAAKRAARDHQQNDQCVGAVGVQQ